MKLQAQNKIKISVISLSVLFVPAILIFSSKPAVTTIYAADGAQIYSTNCARCHGADGRAQTAKGKQTGATDFTSAKWQPNPNRAIRTIRNGKGKMPAFKDNLSSDEISAVWEYIRGRFR